MHSLKVRKSFRAQSADSLIPQDLRRFLPKLVSVRQQLGLRPFADLKVLNIEPGPVAKSIL